MGNWYYYNNHIDIEGIWNNLNEVVEDFEFGD